MSQTTMQIFEHPQEQSRVVGKIGANNHIIKVHILSNTQNLAGRTYEYSDLNSIPESFFNEVVGLPVPREHNHVELTGLFTKLEKEGKTDCEIRRALMEKSGERSIGIVDDVYKPSKISFNNLTIIPEVDLFGTIEITDPVENEYIEKHGEPSHRFTSISTFGPHQIKPDGAIVYNDLGKVRPFELALVKDPAFGKHKAMVRGVCRDDKTACRNSLAFASVIPDGMESINTDSNVISNMSNKNQVEVPVSAVVETPVATIKDTAPIQPDETSIPEKTTVADIKEPVKEESIKEPQQQQQQSGNKEIDELRAQLEKQAKEIEERKRTYRNDLLSFTLDPKAFKSEEELNTEKQNVMTIFEKYNFSDDHAKWLVTKAFPRVTSAPQSENKKGTVYNSLSYNPSDHIKSVSSNTDSAPKTNNNKKRIDLVELQY